MNSIYMNYKLTKYIERYDGTYYTFEIIIERLSHLVLDTFVRIVYFELI